MVGTGVGAEGILPVARFSQVVVSSARAGAGGEWNGIDLDKADLPLMDMGCRLDRQLLRDEHTEQ